MANNQYGIKALYLYSMLTKFDFSVVDRNTDLIIEGYPRSANTRFVAALRLSQGRSIKIAHHVHGNQQILLGIKYGIPTVLLIRDPLDASISLILRDKGITPKQAITDYIKFYTPLVVFRNEVVVSSFNETINNLDKIINKINTKYSTNLKTLSNSEISENDIKTEILRMDMVDKKKSKVNNSTVSLPVFTRNEKKYLIRAKIKNSLQLNTTLKKAYILYEHFL